MATLKRKAELTAAANDPKKPKKDSSLTSFFGPPKTTSSSTNRVSSTPPEAQGAAPKFDKEKWVATLSKEQKDLLKLEIDTLDLTWLSHLKDEITKPGFLDLKRFLKRELDAGKTVFPPPEDIYSWSRHTPLNTVKVVMLGQDPYHNNNQAHGLCFSVRPPTPAPPSLQNMFKELKDNYPSFRPPPNRSGLLTPWAEQGILLLNTCLTVRAHEANSHSSKGWEAFTQKVIDTVVKVRNRGVVFLAWGAPAQKRCTKITGGKHVVMKCAHPSGLSAHKGFFGCGHFKKANDWLEERYGKEGVINWDLNVQQPINKPAVGDKAVKVTASEKTGKDVSNGQKKEAKTKAKVKAAAEDEFDDAEDEDAIEALHELIESDAIEPPASSAVNDDVEATPKKNGGKAEKGK